MLSLTLCFAILIQEIMQIIKLIGSFIGGQKLAGKKNKKTKNNNRLMTKFFKVFFITFIIFSLVGVMATGSYYLVSKGKQNDRNNDNNISSDQDIKEEDQKEPKREKTNFVIYGVDKDGYRTDVIMLAMFNHITKKIDIISIPRDTRVKLPDDIYSELSNKKNIPSVMKVNAIPAYIDIETSEEVLERIFDINIDYYVKMNLDGFQKIVDTIGGVEVDIPKDMYYVDEYQDLYINLEKGKQTLYGAQAEQLIRYRKGYANGDIGRIQMQHEFMKEFMKKLLSDRNKLNMINIITTMEKYVETDFYDVMDYLKYMNDISVDNLTMHNLPGEAKYINNISYFIRDEEATEALMDSILNPVEEENKEEEKETETPNKDEVISSLDKNIEVLNSTGVSGLAGKNKKMLEEEGFTVTRVGNYNPSLEQTTIIVTKEGMGEDITTYFNDPIIEISSEELENDIDIRIIIGLDDKN